MCARVPDRQHFFLCRTEVGTYSTLKQGQVDKWPILSVSYLIGLQQGFFFKSSLQLYKQKYGCTIQRRIWQLYSLKNAGTVNVQKFYRLLSMGLGSGSGQYCESHRIRVRTRRTGGHFEHGTSTGFHLDCTSFCFDSGLLWAAWDKFWVYKYVLLKELSHQMDWDIVNMYG